MHKAVGVVAIRGQVHSMERLIEAVAEMVLVLVPHMATTSADMVDQVLLLLHTLHKITWHILQKY
jgi:hypothetical protein